MSSPSVGLLSFGWQAEANRRVTNGVGPRSGNDQAQMNIGHAYLKIDAFDKIEKTYRGASASYPTVLSAHR
jgi:hypothetical protein